jgi:hypothetical protein
MRYAEMQILAGFFTFQSLGAGQVGLFDLPDRIKL